MTQKIIVVHLITGLDRGGAEAMLFRLVTQMNTSDFENIVVSMQSVGIWGPLIQKAGIQVHCLQMKPSKFDFSGFFKFYFLIRKLRPNILQTWLYHADFLGLVVGKFTRVSHILWNIRCSKVELHKYSRLVAWLVSLLAKLSYLPDRILVNSYAGLEHHKKIGYHAQKWEVIPNGFDVLEFKPDENAKNELRSALGIPTNALLIGMIARYDFIKDHTTFLRAAHELIKSTPNCYFLLAGKDINWDNFTLVNQIETLGLKNSVFLLNEQSQIAGIMAALDICSLTSISEGFSNVLGEAMACEVPCVATDVGDSTYIIGQTGITVPPSNPILLAKAWKNIIDLSPNERNELGKKARQKILEEFTIDQAVKRYETIYKELCTDPVLR